MERPALSDAGVLNLQPACRPQSSVRRGMAHIGGVKCTVLPPEDTGYLLASLPVRGKDQK